jgi:hypothetical protein
MSTGSPLWYPWKLSDMCPADRQFAAARPTVLMFLGNVVLSLARPSCVILPAASALTPLPVRSYGHSEGTPSEKGT